MISELVHWGSEEKKTPAPKVSLSVPMNNEVEEEKNFN